MRFLLLSLMFLSTLAHAETPLITTDNLQIALQKAQSEHKPLALLITYQGIQSGETLKEEAIYPELKSGAFDDKAVFYELVVGLEKPMIDFDGGETSRESFLEWHNLKTTPVMLFFTPQGERFGEPLLAGAYEYYGYWMNEALAK